jgi:hypothetical protein
MYHLSQLAPQQMYRPGGTIELYCAEEPFGFSHGRFQHRLSATSCVPGECCCTIYTRTYI